MDLCLSPTARAYPTFTARSRGLTVAAPAFIFATLTIVSLTLGSAPAFAARTCYTMALPAMSSPLRTRPQWAPFVDMLSQRSGVCPKPRVSDNLAQFDARLSMGEPDVAMPPSSSLIHFDTAARYTPLVTSRSMRVRGVLVVRRDSGVQTPDDLRTEGLVEVGVASALARFMSIAPQRALRRAGVRCRVIDFGNPSNVLRAVALGRVPVGASIDLVLEDYEPVIRDQLRVIFATERHLKWPIAAHARVPEEVRVALTEAVLGMAADDAGRVLLHRVHLDDPIRTTRAAYVADLAGEPDLHEVCDTP